MSKKRPHYTHVGPEPKTLEHGEASDTLRKGKAAEQRALEKEGTCLFRINPNRVNKDEGDRNARIARLRAMAISRGEYKRHPSTP